MKLLIKHIILLVILFTTSCKESKVRDEKYILINTLIEKYRDNENSVKIFQYDVNTMNYDTITFNEFTVDPFAGNCFSLDFDLNILIFNDSFDSLNFENFFPKSDLIYIQDQLDTMNNIKWNRKLINFNKLNDSSFLLEKKELLESINIKIWNNVLESGKDYLIINQPIFSSDNNTAIIYTALYTNNNFLSTFINAKKYNDKWSFVLQYSLVFEFSEAFIQNSTLKETSVFYKGEIALLGSFSQ